MQALQSSRIDESQIYRAPAGARRVLLVEDDPEYAGIVSRALCRNTPPLWVHREDRLDAALGRLERECYDAMIVDLSLPDGDGRATLGYACAVANHLPVLVLTGRDDDSLSVDAIRAGAQDYLVKQRTQARVLAGAVLHAIERHQLLQKRRALGMPTGSRGDLGRALGARDVRSDETLLRDHLERAIARAGRRHESIAVFVASYDDLDLLGELLPGETMEELLGRATQELAVEVRRCDIMAPLGSGRFAVVVGECPESAPELRRIGQTFRQALKRVEGHPVQGAQVVGFVVRVGVSTYPRGGDDAETLLNNAQAAAERAGRSGGVVLDTPSVSP